MDLGSPESDVVDRVGCVRVIEALANDLERNRAGWENATIPAYLEAVAGWITTMTVRLTCDVLTHMRCPRGDLNPHAP